MLSYICGGCYMYLQFCLGMTGTVTYKKELLILDDLTLCNWPEMQLLPHTFDVTALHYTEF